MINLNNFCKYAPNIVWDKTYTKNLFFIHLKFKYKWVSWGVLFGFAKSGSL